MTRRIPWLGVLVRGSGPALRRMGAAERETILRDQAQGMFFMNWLYAVLGIASAAGFLLGYADPWQVSRLVPTLAIVASYLLMLAAAFRWRRRGDDLAFIRWSTWLKFAVGLGWAALIAASVSDMDLSHLLFVVGLMMALTATAIVSAPLESAVAFLVPIGAVGIYVVTILMPPVDGMTVAGYFAYLVFIAAATIYYNGMIVTLSLRRLEIQRKHETISVFLREYEDGSDDWLWVTDAELRFRDVEAHGRAGFPPADIPARAGGLRGLASIRGGIAAGDASGAERLRAALRDRVAFRNLVVPARSPDALRWLNLTGHPIFEDGRFGGYRGIASDVTEARRTRQRMEFLATHDGLTALLARQAFVDRLDALCARPDPRGLVVALLDLDDFKRINDTFGHHIGDEVIREIAQRITAMGGKVAHGARFGGDEFALCFVGTGVEEAASSLRELIATLAQPIAIGTLRLELGASAGLAPFGAGAGTSKELLRFADMGLYTAKGAGKGQVRVFEPAMEQEYSSRIRLQHELLRAIESGQIEIEYQPIYDVASGTLVSREALARWNHPTRGKLAAGAFIPVAETSGLIDRLGASVLRNTCLEAASWDRSVGVSVNVSARQLRSGLFTGLLADVLAESALAPARLALEVTESVLVDQQAGIVSQLEAIRALGVQLVLDDFGTGFSSLAYLHRFTVDGLKIDHTFTRDLLRSPKVGAIVRSVADLAAKLGIYVVAEGVETEAQLAWLRENGIRFGQGFLFGEPSATPLARVPVLQGAPLS